MQERQKGGIAVDDDEAREAGEAGDSKRQDTKELLEVLEKALEGDTVERITITIKPNKNQKQR